MLEVDIPDVLAELEAAFEAYGRALTTREAERQYGHEEIAAFRIQRGVVNQSRTLTNPRITTFGRDFGITNTEFHPDGSAQIGRQSQTWIRTDSGWKIVSAHVSFGL